MTSERKVKRLTLRVGGHKKVAFPSCLHRRLVLQFHPKVMVRLRLFPLRASLTPFISVARERPPRPRSLGRRLF